MMYVWCSRNRPWHCPVLFYRNCCRGSHRGTRVIYQTHTHKHIRLGAAQFKCNLVGLTMEQLLWSSWGFSVMLEGNVFLLREEKGNAHYYGGEKSMSSSFPFRGSLCLTWLLLRRVWQTVIGFKMITFCAYTALCLCPEGICRFVIHTSPMYKSVAFFFLFSLFLCLSIQFFVSFILSLSYPGLFVCS